MKNKWGWENGDLGIVLCDEDRGFSVGEVIELECCDGTHFPNFIKRVGTEIKDDYFMMYKNVLRVKDLFLDISKPTYNEIQMFEMLYPQLTGIIKENNND